jgi:putative lipoic acid-binding regulatory protein
MTIEKKQAIFVATSCGLLLLGPVPYQVQSFAPPVPLCSLSSSYSSSTSTGTSLKMASSTPPDKPAGSFFHQVPDDSNRDNGSNEEEDNQTVTNTNINFNNDVVLGDAAAAAPDFNDAVSDLLRQRRKPPRASRPSTINGVPTEKATGFGKPNNHHNNSNKRQQQQQQQKPSSPSSASKKPYVAIGPPSTNPLLNNNEPINDPSRPQVDDQGYTLYTDEETGEKSRVFEALVDYPCIFTMKIVGANEGTFVQDMVAIVAEACETKVHEISHSTKAMGKWTSVTVEAPVESSEMLYSLYEKVDLDPRVKFKF